MSNKTNQGKQVCLSDYAKCILSAVKNSFTKTLKVKASKLALATLLLGVLGTNGFAQIGTISWENNAEEKFSCNSLYGVTDYGLGTMVTTDLTVWRAYEILNQSGFQAQNLRTYGFASVAPVGYRDGDTLAVGYLGGLNEDGTPRGALTSYSWFYGDDNIIYMNAVSEGDTVATQHYISGTGGIDWVGGEVEQKTGYIIFMGPLNYPIGSISFLYYDPVSKTIIKKISGLTAEIPGEINWGAIRSDMALDGDGNIYVLSDTNNIIKVDVAKKTYKRIVTLGTWPAGPRGDIFGTAFLNGKFFMARGTGIYSADLMSGAITHEGTTPRQMFDLATCQTASVIKGKVFYDAAGTGIAPSGTSSGIANAKVEIFKDVNGVISFKGVMQTPADGSYEFVTDSDDATYYIRVKQPVKDSINLAQTWAGADNTKKNIVSAFCADASNNTVEHSSSTQCIGARIAGVDQTDFSSDFKSSAQFYSKVVMKTSLEVPEVNFAFTDARNTASLYQAAAHILTPEPTLFLGTDVTVGESLNNNDVLVDIENDGNYVNLGNQVLVAGETYKFKTQANGLAKEHAFLNAWINWDTTGNKTTYVSTLLNATKPDSSGLIEFNMTIPDAITSVTPGNKTSALRFRLSTLSTINATSINGPAQESVPANTIPWTIDGEVVDYQILVKVIGPADLSKSTIIANPTDLMAGLTSNITVILKDALGSELVKKQDSVTIYITNGNAELFGNSTNGKIVVANYLSGANYTANLTSSVANTVTVGFGVGAVNSTNSTTVTFTAGSYSDTHSNITADPLKLVVDSTSLITVTLRDVGGNLIDNKIVVITNSTSSTGTLGDITPIGSLSGNYTATFTTTKAGNHTFSYKVDGSDSTNSVTIEFTSGTPDVNGTSPNSNTAIVVDPSTSGVDTNENVTVTITDIHGNPITDLSDVKIYIVSGTGNLSGGIQEVDAVNAGGGNYTTNLTSSVANTVTVGFKVGADTSSLTATGTFTAGSYSDTNSDITADPLKLVVDSTSLITVTLRDALGNPLDDETVVITNSTSSTGTLGAITPVGVNSGNYTATFTTTKAGNHTFSYKVDGSDSTNSVTIEFTSGTPDVNGTSPNSKTAIVVDPSTSGVDTNENVTVTITDIHGNPITDLSDVKIYIVSGTGNLSGGIQEVAAVNAGGGNYTTNLTSSVANTVTVGFKVGADTSSLTATGTFTAGSYSDADSSITADPLKLVVDSTSLITVTLRDALGNPLDDETVVITNSTSSTGTLGAITPVGVNSGNYTATFTTTKAGNHTFSYKVDGSDSTNSVTIEFTSGTPDVNGTSPNSNTAIVVDPSTSGVDTNENVTVTITDIHGNPITDLSDVKIYIVSGTGNLSGGVKEVDAVNAGGGNYTTNLTSSVANTVTVGFKVGADTSSLTATGTFTAGVYSDADSSITADPLKLVVDSTSLITVTLRDALGNPLDDETVVITNSTSSTGTLGAITPVGVNSGNYTATFTTTKAGNHTFSYKVDGSDSTNSVTIEFTSGTPDVNGTSPNSKTAIVVDPSTSGVDTNENVTVTITDIHGNPITDLSDVKIYIVSGTGNLSGGIQEVAAVNAGGGNYTTNLTSSVANTVTVGFKVGADTSSLTATGTFTAGSYSDADSSITADPLKLVVDSTSLITVTLRDALGNPLDDETVVITNSTSSTGTLGAITPVGVNSGNYTATFTTTKAGNHTFSYKVDGSDSTNSVTIEFTSGTPDVNGTSPNSNTAIVVDPSTSGVDTNENVTVTITDIHGNPITDLSDVKIYIVSGTGNLSGGIQEVDAVNAGGGNYTTNLTSSVANTVTVGFKVGADTSSLTATGTFTAGVYSDTNSDITADPLKLVVDSTSLITVTLRDALGNPLDDETVVITNSTSSTGTLGAITPVGVNSGNYTATFTTTKAGNHTFSYKVDGSDSTNSVTIEFTSGTPDVNGTSPNSKTAIVVDPSTSGVDTNENVTVTITDIHGNPITDLSDVKIYIVSGTGNLSGGIQEVAAVNAGGGNYTTNLTSSVANTVTVGFKVGADTSSLTATGTFTAGSYSDADSDITADPLKLVVDSTSLITVTLRDALGNPLDDETVVITNIAGPTGGTLGDINPVGVNSGNYTATFTTTKAGNHTFSYKVDGSDSTNSVTIEFTSGTPDVNGTSPNSKTAIVVDPSTSGVDTNENVTVTITDIHGNPITDLSDVKIYIVSGTGNLSGGIQEVDAVNAGGGNYTTNLTSSVANTVTVGFKVGADTSSLTATGTFTAGSYSDADSDITADPLKLVVDSTSLITVTLRDALGNPLDDETVVITNSTSSTGTLGAITPVGVNSGNYTATFTTTKAGNHTFSYKVDGSDSTNSVTIEFTSGTPDVNGTSPNSKTAIVVDPSTSGVDTNENVTVTITDIHGNPITDLSDVKIYIVSGTGNLSGGIQEVAAVNAGGGNYTTNLTSSVANTVTVGFKVGADTSSLSANGIFTAGSYSDADSSITADPLKLVVDSTSLITVTLKDALGNPLDDETVVITNIAGPTGGTLGDINPIGVNSGNYTATFTTTKAGNHTFSYKVDGSDSTNSVTIEFTSGTPDVNGTSPNSNTAIVVDPSTSGVDTNENVTVTITDIHGNPITDLSDVKIYIVSGDGNLSGGIQEVAAVNAGGGNYTTNLTSSVANTVTVGFKVGADTSSLTATGTFTAGSYSDADSDITADPLKLVVDSTSLITVTLRDALGNPLDDETVVITNSTSSTGTLGAITPVGVNSGNYTATFTTTKAGNHTFSYKVDGSDSTNSVTIEFTSGTPDVNGTSPNSKTAIVVDPSTSGVDTNENVTVTITDIHGNPITDLSDVKIYIVSGTGNLSGGIQEVAAVNAGGGNYTTNLTSSVANTVTVGFKVGADTSSLTATGTFTAGSYSDADSDITADPLKLVVDSTSLITVTLRDALGNPLDEKSVVITNIAGPTGGTLGTINPTGSLSGNYTATFTTTKAGNYTFSYSVDGSDSTNSVTIEFTSGTPDVNGTSPNSNTAIVVDPSTSGVDTNENVTVTITDIHGNPITDLSDVKIYIVSGTGNLSGGIQEVAAVNAGDGNYTTNLTSSVANTVTVGFKVGADTSSLEATGTFTAGSYSDADSSITADPLKLVVDSTSLITVTLKDINGNPLDEKSVVITNIAGPTGGTLGIINPTGSLSGNYTATFTTTKAGNYTFSYSVDGGAQSSKSVTIEFTAGTPDVNGTSPNSKTAIVVNPSTSGVNTNENVTVTITDIHGNPITDLSDVKIYIVSGTGSLSGGIQEVAAVNAGDGTYTTNLTSSVANTVTVGFKVGADTSSLEATGTFTAGSYSDADSSITADPLKLVVDSTSLITVTLKDADGNPLDEKSVVITNIAGPTGGTLGIINPIGSLSGNYTATFTTTKAGNYTFSYTAEGVQSTKNVTIEFTSGTPDVNGTSPNSKTAIVVDPSTSGVDTNLSVTVTITDIHGNPITDLSDVKIYITSGDGNLSGGVQEVDAVNAGDGTYITKLTSSVANIVTVGFKVGADTSSLTATGTFTAGSYSDTNSDITADPLKLVVDSTSLITVTLRDALGNPLDDETVVITNIAGPTGGTLGAITPVGVNSGNYTATFTTTKAGNHTFSYKVDGSDSTNSVTIEFTSGTPDVNGTSPNSKTAIVVDPSTSGVDTNLSVTVTITDIHGNPITDLSDVKIYITSGDGNLSGGVKEVDAVNAGDGNYTTNLTSSVANIVTVGFKVGADTSSLSANGIFTAGSYSDADSSITADPLKLVVDSTSLITVTLRDAKGNPLDDETVVITNIAGPTGGTLGNINPIGSLSGNYTATFTTTKAGNYTFSYKVDGSDSTNSVTIEFTAGAVNVDSSTIKSTYDNGTETANLAVGEFGRIIVTLYDQSGNKITNYLGQVYITIQSGVGELSSANFAGTKIMADQNTDGTYYVYIRSFTPGDANVTFSVKGVVSSKSIIVTFGDTGSDLYVELTSLSKKAKTGDIVRFQALVENRGSSTVSNFTLSNIIPAGFSYVDNSAYILDSSGADITNSLTVTWNSPLKINNINLASHEKMTAMFFLRVGGAVKAGKHVVTATSYSNPQLGKKLSNTASADVEISTNDPMLDESLIFGTVFHDRNGDGAQDRGEEGLPGVKIATAGGYVVTTDQYGRYHLLNILGGEWSRGRNFIMKVDKASLPRGTKFTTSNPQTRRITPGIPVRYDFGVQILGDANKTGTLVEQGGQK